MVEAESVQEQQLKHSCRSLLQATFDGCATKGQLRNDEDATVETEHVSACYAEDDAGGASKAVVSGRRSC